MNCPRCDTLLVSFRNQEVSQVVGDEVREKAIYHGTGVDVCVVGWPGVENSYLGIQASDWVIRFSGHPPLKKEYEE